MSLIGIKNGAKLGHLVEGGKGMASLDKLFFPLVDAFVVVGATPEDTLQPILRGRRGLKESGWVMTLHAGGDHGAMGFTPTVLDCFPESQASWDVVQSMPMVGVSD
jgi:hypothetical protein